jgi:hypothetical protein
MKKLTLYREVGLWAQEREYIVPRIRIDAKTDL